MPSRSSAARSQAPRATGARAAGARARSAPRPAPRRVALRPSVVRVRWERVGRIALLVVLLGVVGLYAAHAASYVSTRKAASRARATYVQLAREHRELEQQARRLKAPAAIVRRARQLGMTRAGEQPYVSTGESASH